ncbi:Low affinity iron permease, Fet4 [Niveomyces insectorum RCEF 264]|uniref:Low affinity iron permease, Fet4 n=1 Tax=Niveomyces insectorum RCEF 264 TaxID=1081102 RepID=A0A167MLS3_9HYPO|nr:Low affinity iron permease, Fet4 [Niveomyces insectorum RCEF 264]
MPNPFTAAGRAIAAYTRNLKNAPAAQYMTRVAAPSVIPSTTTLPPPAYQPRDGRPASQDSFDDVAVEKERLKTAAALTSGGGAGPLPSWPAATPQKKGTGAFDFVVKMAGSRWTFLVTMLLLGGWAALGVVYGPTDTWQVILQDVSSIQCYISATLLMRQQQNSTRALLGTICGMLSRAQGNERMLRQLSGPQRQALKHSRRALRRDLASALATRESVFDRVANAVARGLGSLAALAVYWAGIVVWVFWGIPLQWSDTWQLDVNTATALELTFTTMFLQNVRRQHEEYLARCLRSIDVLDRDLELHLRRMTGDMQPNPVVASQPPRLRGIEKAIDFWAFIVGGSVGVCLSCAVGAAWLAVGDVMHFDDNWWLIIGTYTGLMGFVDGFVLRNVHHRETIMADKHFAMLVEQDLRLFTLIDMPFPEEDNFNNNNNKIPVATRISHWIGHVCEVPGATVASVVIVVALLAVASAMQWTETGQLLCNTPTMIVEGFLLLMLIEGHNGAEHRRRTQYTDILDRRLQLERRVAAWEDKYELDLADIDDLSIADVLSISEKYKE